MHRAGLVILILASVSLSACGSNDNRTTVIEQENSYSRVIPESTTASFNTDVIESKTPVLVDFYATWCGPCKRMEPVVDQVAKQYQDQIKVVRVDVDKNPELANRYHIQAIPNLILFKDGDIVNSVVGVTTAEKLSSRVRATI